MMQANKRQQIMDDWGAFPFLVCEMHIQETGWINLEVIEGCVTREQAEEEAQRILDDPHKVVKGDATVVVELHEYIKQHPRTTVSA